MSKIFYIIPASDPCVSNIFYMSTAATGINNKGEVVGNAAVAVSPTNTSSHGFLYSNGQTIDIGVLPGAPYSYLYPAVYPQSINNKSQVVGSAFAQVGTTAFPYQNGQIYDLNQLISPDGPLKGSMQLVAAFINDSGVVAANGVDSTTGAVNVYVLTPIPDASAEQ